MKKAVLLFTVFTVLAFSSINECKTDVYFGNGILTEKPNAISNAGILENAIIEKFGPDYYQKHIGTVRYAYNQTSGIVVDLLESAAQKLSLQALVDAFSLVHSHITDHLADSARQLTAYKNSIMQGHRVLVVAHSQGNFYAGELFKQLPGWMQDYFEAVSVASPMSSPVKDGTPRIDWDNDPVAHVSSIGSRTSNPVRKVEWKREYDPSNPPKRDDNGLIHVAAKPADYVYDQDIGRYYAHQLLAVEDGLDFGFKVHSFAYYMGEALGRGNIKNPFDKQSTLKTDVARSMIMDAVEAQLLYNLSQVPSQWVTKGGGKKKKKCKLKNCKSKRERLTHRFDPRHMDAMLNGALVLPFDDDGKVYPVGGAYVKASCGGTSVTKNPEEGICFRLEGTGETIEGEDGGPSQLSIKKSIRPVSTTLSWDKASDVAMSVSMSKNPGGPPKVGDVYKMNASGGLKDGSQITAECLQDDPIHITARVNTPNDLGFSQYEITDPSQLDLKTYGIVVVEKGQRAKYHPGSGHGSGSFDHTPVRHRDYIPVRTYNKCQEKKNKKTCGCVPCQFMVYGMQKTSQYGPIAEGDVTIIPAEDNNKANPQILYHTVTTADRDTLKTGIINIDQDSLNRFEDDRYYIVRVQGGVDVDSDDDFIYDDMPTRNHGTIHAVVKGSDLKKVPFVVNVLTEAIYQVSGDMLGEMYDASELSDALDERATKLINTKLDITSTHKEIDYKDVLLWTPAADKYTLIKPYKTYVQPIVEKTYSNSPRADESYELIYGEYNTSMPILAPLSLEIQAGLPNQTPIAKVSVQNDKNYAHIEIDGTYADAFVIGDDGLIRIARTDTITEGGFYDLRMRAVDENGSRGSWAGLLIRVNGEANVSDSAPILQTVETYPLHENAPEGAKVAQVVYTGDVTHYHLVGMDRAKFSIDSSGTIRVANGADIDYESSPSCTIGIVATNDRGVSSSPFEVKVPVMNEMDTPVLPVQITKTIRENVPIGTEVATIDVLREGKSPIESFKILNPRMPFGIDKTGTIYTTAPIDYEETKSYTFMVIATTQNGNSNKVKCTVIVKDVEPEPPKTLIDDAVFTVDENMTMGSRIGSLGVHTQGSPVQKIILSGKDAYAFKVDTNGTLYLSDHIGLDYERQRRFVFGAKALDETGYGKEAKIVIEVANVPDTPPTIRGFTVKLNENHTYSAKAVVGVLEIRDPGEGNISDYSLSGADSELFDVDTNGTVMFKGDTRLDYETKSEYQFSATAVSTSGVSKPATITIDIADAVDTPPVILESRLSIEENASKGTKIGSISVPPVYKKDINFTIAKDPLHALSIDRNGTVYLAKEGVLDFEKNTSYVFEVAASNAFGTSTPRQQTIRIIDTGTVPTLKSTTLLVPFDKDPVSGLEIGMINFDNGDGTITAVTLDGNGSEYFAINRKGNVTLADQIDLSTKRTFELEAKASNEFGVSAPVKVSINFEPKPEIQAGADMTVYANKAFSLHGKVDEAYRDRIKEIRWSSPQTNKINCIETNTTTCKVAGGLLPGEYDANLTVTYVSGWAQGDTLHIHVLKAPESNTLGALEMPVKGLKQMRLSQDGKRIYAAGDFDGDEVFKIIDVSDPEQMHVLSAYTDTGSIKSGEHLALNADETRAVIADRSGFVVLDISDPESITEVIRHDSNNSSSVYNVRWYQGDTFVYEEGEGGDKPTTLHIVRADTLETVKEVLADEHGWGIGEIGVVPEQALMVVDIGRFVRIIDANNSTVLFEQRHYGYEHIGILHDASTIIYGTDPLVVDISDRTNIHTNKAPWTKLLGRLTFFGANKRKKEAYFYDRNGGLITTLHYRVSGEENYLSETVKVEGKITQALMPQNGEVAYVFSEGDGLRAVSLRQRNRSVRLIGHPDTLNFAWFRGSRYAYGLDMDIYMKNISGKFFISDNLERVHESGSIELRRPCYPDCGYRWDEPYPVLFSLGQAVASGDGEKLFVPYTDENDTLLDFMILDIDNKEQNLTYQLDTDLHEIWWMGKPVVTEDGEALIVGGTKYDNATKEWKALVKILNADNHKLESQTVLRGFAGRTFHMQLCDQDQKLAVLTGSKIYLLDIQAKKKPKIIGAFSLGGGSAIRAFAITKDSHWLYAIDGERLYVFDLSDQQAKYPISQYMLSVNSSLGIALSPLGNHLAVAGVNGVEIFDLADHAHPVQSNFILYPYQYTEKGVIYKNENVLFAGGYILKIQ